MNIKMADFLFEDVGENENDSNKNKQDEKNSQPEQQDDEGRKQIRSKLDDADLFSDVELNYAEVKKLCANLATIVTSADKNIIRLTKAFESIKSKDAADLSDEEKKDVEELKEIESKPLGLITPQLLTTLFKKNLSAGFSGKIGKIHLNPFQMIIGKDQVEGATAQDFAAYEKEGAVFAMLSDENSKVVNCNGKAIVIMIPALMANVSDHLDVYSITYPEVTKDSPVIRSVSQLFFTLLTKDDIKSLQTDPKKIRSFVAREKKQEHLVYKLGLSSILLEDAGISQQTPSLSQGGEDSTETGESDVGKEESSDKEKSDDNESNSDTQSSLIDKIENAFNGSPLQDNVEFLKGLNANDKKLKKATTQKIKDNIFEYLQSILNYVEDDTSTMPAVIGGIFYKRGKSKPNIRDPFMQYVVNSYLNYLKTGEKHDLYSVYNNAFDDDVKYENLDPNELNLYVFGDKPKKMKKIANEIYNVVGKYFSESFRDGKQIADSLSEDLSLTIDTQIKLGQEIKKFALKDYAVKDDFIAKKIFFKLENASCTDKDKYDFAIKMMKSFDKINNASSVLLQKIETEEISEDQIPLYVLISLKQSQKDYFVNLINEVNEFLRGKIEETSQISERTRSFWKRFESASIKSASIRRMINKSDITELALRWYFNPQWGASEIEKLFESKLSLNSLLLEVDEDQVGKNDVDLDVSTRGSIEKIETRVKGIFKENMNEESVYEALKSMFESENFAAPNVSNLPFFKKMLDKENKQQKSNKEKYIERAANNGKDELLTSILNEVKAGALEVIKTSLKVKNDKFNDFIDNTIGSYFDKAIKKQLKYIVKPAVIIEDIEAAQANNIKIIRDWNPVGLYDDDRSFFVKYEELNVKKLSEYLKKSKDFKDKAFDDDIKKIHVTLLLSECLNEYANTFFDKLFYRIFTRNESDENDFEFDADKFSKFITSEDLLKSLLKGSIRDFESSVLVSDETAETLRDKYIASQGQDEWEKFVIYAYFNEPKNLTDLLKENKVSQKSLLAKALYEDNMFAAEMLLTEMEFLKKAKDKISKFGRETFSGVSDNQKAYLADTITKLSADDNLTPPKGWKSTIEKAEEEGLDEGQLSQLKSARIKQNCKLIIDSSYSMLIRDEWKEYSKSEEARKDSNRAGRESAYDKSGEKIKTMTELGSAAAVIGVGALGMAALPWALGAFIFANEIGNIGGGVASAILKAGDRGFGFAKSKISGKPSVQEKLDALEYDVSLKEETTALLAVIKDITEEHVFEGKHIYDKFSSLSFLLEEAEEQASEEGSSEESESSNKKQELREISEEDVMQYLIERDVKLFSSDFDSDKAYNRFFIRLNAILKKFANIKITGIKDKSVTKEMAKEHVAETTNANAKVGQPASNLIDIFSRQMAMSDQPPVAALASAINDINHSGGGVASLLVYMMLTNPQGFGSLVQTFNGDANNAINQVTDLMAQVGETSQEEVVEQVQEGISEESKPKIGRSQFNRIFDVLTTLYKVKPDFYNDIINHANVDIIANAESYRDDKDSGINATYPFEIVEEDLTDFNQDTYNLIMSLFFNDPTRTLDLSKLSFKKIKDVWSEDDYGYFVYAFMIQYAIAHALGLKKEDIIETKILNPHTYDDRQSLENAFCLNVFYSNVTGEISATKAGLGESADEEFVTKIFQEIRNSKIYNALKTKGLLESRKIRSKSVLSEEYVLGDLSSLLFENVVDKKRKNIVKKEDKIDLQREWRNLWDI